MNGCLFIGIANYTIFNITMIDYMVAAYGPYTAVVIGENGFARDFSTRNTPVVYNVIPRTSTVTITGKPDGRLLRHAVGMGPPTLALFFWTFVLTSCKH